MRAAADVVDEHQAAGLRTGGGADDGNVGTTDGHHLGDEIAGLPNVAACRCWARGALAGEIGLQIGDAAMVDIGVRCDGAPALRIARTVGTHVGVEFFLQVKAKGCAICANDHVGADAAIKWDVAAGKFETLIGRIVDGGDADLG